MARSRGTCRARTGARAAATRFRASARTAALATGASRPPTSAASTRGSAISARAGLGYRTASAGIPARRPLLLAKRRSGRIFSRRPHRPLHVRPPNGRAPTPLNATVRLQRRDATCSADSSTNKRPPEFANPTSAGSRPCRSGPALPQVRMRGPGQFNARMTWSQSSMCSLSFSRTLGIRSALRFSWRYPPCFHAR